MKVITMAHWRRPDYSRQCLESLSRCHGIKDYTLICHVDGEGNPGVPIVCAKFKDMVARLNIVQHKKHQGCNATTRAALESGFAVADFVIHLEDDTPLAPDGLRFFEWATQFGADATFYTVSAWGLLPKRPVQPDDNARAVKRQHFSCWAWATWKDRWQEMDKGWTTGDDHTASWDYQLDKIRGPRFQIQPIISRTTNIGAMLGTHRGDCPVDDWAGRDGFKAPNSFVAEWL